MTNLLKPPNACSCYSEYDILQKVILCSPEFMKIREIINETQKVFAANNIDTSLAIKQHQTLLNTLRQHQVETIMLPAKKQYPEQVFTRDIGFTLGSVLFIAHLKRSIRQGEEQVLIDQLDERNISYVQMTEDSIEGGDVMIDGELIWIGDSHRTSVKAMDKLQQLLPNHRIINLPFDGKYLHLDCVFNVISPNEAIIFPPAFQPSQLEIISRHYEWIEVSPEEQFTLGTNVLSLGNKKLLSLPMNKVINEKLRKRGFTVIEVDISEIIKSGGSFRCVTLPLLRVS